MAVYSHDYRGRVGQLTENNTHTRTLISARKIRREILIGARLTNELGVFIANVRDWSATVGNQMRYDIFTDFIVYDSRARQSTTYSERLQRTPVTTYEYVNISDRIRT